MEKQTIRTGFTLIELITVIAVIAILAGLIIPAVSGVRKSVARSKTKSQFTQYILAYENFKAEYGYYPTMGATGNNFSIEGATRTFYDTLSGQPFTGTILHTYADNANKKRIQFYSFSDTEFDEGSVIVDAFGNPDINIIVDRNNDGIIPDNEIPADIRPDEDLRAGVAIYSDPGNNPDYEWVKSWD